MSGRFYRLCLASLLVLVLLAGYCTAEVAEVECTAEGDCNNPDADVPDNIPVQNVPEPEVSQEAVDDAAAANAEAVADETVDESAEAVPDDTADAPSTDSAAAPEEDPNCPSRELIIRCTGQHLDTNKNGKLDREELQAAIDSLPWYARGILQILGSVDKMMKKCDVDGDDAISMGYDMENNKEQCLASCFKRKAFKSAFFSDCE